MLRAGAQHGWSGGDVGQPHLIMRRAVLQAPHHHARSALIYRIRPLLLGEAEVPNVLDVFWSLSTDRGRSSVPILGFLVQGAEDGPIVVDCGMRDPKRAVDVHRLGPHSCSPEQTLPAQLALHGVSPAEVKTLILT